MALKMVMKKSVGVSPSPMVQGNSQVEMAEPLETVAVESHPELVVTPVSVLVTEYITLWKTFDAQGVKVLVKRMEELRKLLVAYANDTMEGEKPAILLSEAGEVEFSERGKETVITTPLTLVNALIEKFDENVAANVVDIRLTVLRQLLTPLEMQPYTLERPGSRILKAVRPSET